MVRVRKRDAETVRGSSATNSGTELDSVKRELQEALDRQAATDEILHIISNSPNDTQPVFEAIVRTGSASSAQPDIQHSRAT